MKALKLPLTLSLASLYAWCNPIFAQTDIDEISEQLSLEELYDLPIVQIATGTAVPLEKAPAVASLITAKDIKAMGALTIDEVLESVPGLHIIPSTLNRLTPVYTFRGMYTGQNPQVLFMLNGHRVMGDLFGNGMTHLTRMNVENISRIEVVRGPGSAVYGADAYSGVINIITKSAQEIDGFHFGVRGGSHQTKNAWAQYGGNIFSDWQLAVNLEFFDRNSDTSRKVGSDQQTNFDGLFGSSASLAPGHLEDRFEATNYNIHLNNQNWSIGLDGYVKRDSGLGAGAAQALDDKGFDDYDQYLLTLGYENKELVEDWQFDAQFSYYYSEVKPELVLFPSGTVLPVGSDGNIFTPHDGMGCATANIPGIGCLTTFNNGALGNPGGRSRIPSFEATALYEGWAGHNLRFNIGIKKEKYEAFESKNFGPGVLDSGTLNGAGNPELVNGTLTSITNTPFVYSPDVDRSVKYVSLQDIWEIDPDWTLTAGVRYDHYSDFGNTVNPRVALVWTPTDKLITKLLYGEAFRAPSFSELHSQNNPVILGNKHLDPETIKTTELALSYEVNSQLTTGLNLYHYKTQDMIEFVPNSSDGSSTAQNNKSIVGNGIELEASWKVNQDLKITANYAYQKTEDDETDEQVEYVPKQQFYLDARWNFQPDWELSSQLNWVGDRERADSDTRSEISDYTLVNLTLRRTNLSLGSGKKNWEIAATIKNLFDKEAYEPSDGAIADDYPLNERRFYAEIRYHLPN